MNKFLPSISIETSKTGEILYFRIHPGKIKVTKEYVGSIFIDYDKHGKILGVEILSTKR
jgi:uncharacterized protein YuzE